MDKETNKEQNQIVDFIRETWPIWSVLVGFLAFIGFFEALFNALVPPWATIFIGIGLVLGVIPVLVLSYVQIQKLRIQLRELQKNLKMTEELKFPTLFIEGVPVQSLLAHIEYRRQVTVTNTVQLELFEINCRIVGDGVRKDADVTYHLKGTNLSQIPLKGLYLTIAADNLVPLSDLNCRLYDLTRDPEREVRLYPRLTGLDTTRKDLLLPLLLPGVDPFQQFELELQYRWPAIFSTVDDYWFLDNIDFEGRTKKIRLCVEFVTMEVETVRMYTVGPKYSEPQFLGALRPEKDKPAIYCFEMDESEMGLYYIMLFRSKRGEHATKPDQERMTLPAEFQSSNRDSMISAAATFSRN